MIIEKTNPQAILPTKREEDSGYDFYTPADMETVILKPGENKVINLGLKIQLPKSGDGGQFDMTFTNRSSVASRRNLVVGACLIDNGYRGELMVDLHNIGTSTEAIIGGEKIVQGVIRKSYHFSVFEEKVDDDTERGEGGFGSTGK